MLMKNTVTRNLLITTRYECGTPVSDSNFLQSFRGGSYGTRCNLEYFNKENARWIMRPDTEIKNLYTAGQDAWVSVEGLSHQESGSSKNRVPEKKGARWP